MKIYNIYVHILFLFFIILLNEYTAQTVKRNNLNKTITGKPSLQAEYNRKIDNTVNSFYTNSIKFVDSLSSNLSDHLNHLNNNALHNYDSLKVLAQLSFTRERVDTLHNSFNNLVKFIPSIIKWKDFSHTFVGNEKKKIISVKNSFLSRTNISQNDFDERFAAFNNLKDSVYDYLRDYIATSYENSYDQLNETYYTVRDSLDTIYSTLNDNQQTENDLIAERKQAIEDSISEASSFSEEITAPFSIYALFSYGFDRNPLYNYERIGDQLKQMYLEMNLKSFMPRSSFRLSYVSSLMLFNFLKLRNYYEHNLTVKYRIKYNLDSLPIPQSEVEEGNEKFSSLNFSTTIGARHNRNYYNDYNNESFDFTISFKKALDSTYYYQLKNSLCYRNYSVIAELSNFTELFTFEISKTTLSRLKFGLTLAAGAKVFTETIYDTTNTAVIGPNGKPKKQITITAQPNNSYHISAGFNLSKIWDNSSIQSYVLYRSNLKSEARYLSKYVNTTFLTEDIYNDYFAYSGPEFKIVYNHKIFDEILLMLTTELQFKNLNLPAFNLLGGKNSSKRTDFRSYCELNISKYFNVGESFGIDLSLTCGLLRNQSNDEYNDYSSFLTSIGIGIGF